MRVLSVTLELETADEGIVVPNSVTRFLGVKPGEELEARLSIEGRIEERNVSLGRDGKLEGFHHSSGPALLTLWSPAGREVEKETFAPTSSLADSLHRLARELDPEAQGLPVAEIRDAALSRGLLGGNSDPYRQVYTTLSYARDRFSRVGRATFRWQDPDPQAKVGLGGRRLLEAATAWCRTHDPENEGTHYQRIVAGLAEDGTPAGSGHQRNRLVSQRPYVDSDRRLPWLDS